MPLASAVTTASTGPIFSARTGAQALTSSVSPSTTKLAKAMSSLIGINGSVRCTPHSSIW